MGRAGLCGTVFSAQQLSAANSHSSQECTPGAALSSSQHPTATAPKSALLVQHSGQARSPTSRLLGVGAWVQGPESLKSPGPGSGQGDWSLNWSAAAPEGEGPRPQPSPSKPTPCTMERGPCVVPDCVGLCFLRSSSQQPTATAPKSVLLVQHSGQARSPN